MDKDKLYSVAFDFVIKTAAKNIGDMNTAIDSLQKYSKLSKEQKEKLAIILKSAYTITRCTAELSDTGTRFCTSIIDHYNKNRYKIVVKMNNECNGQILTSLGDISRDMQTFITNCDDFLSDVGDSQAEHIKAYNEAKKTVANANHVAKWMAIIAATGFVVGGLLFVVPGGQLFGVAVTGASEFVLAVSGTTLAAATGTKIFSKIRENGLVKEPHGDAEKKVVTELRSVVDNDLKKNVNKISHESIIYYETTDSDTEKADMIYEAAMKNKASFESNQTSTTTMIKLLDGFYNTQTPTQVNIAEGRIVRIPSK
ncbi:predicted protein [Naegleria gruberi]|uniref:Predicted protein n=1 Tax=Naegleria gruberi TaxID=5762 RepID=D2VMM2_NAEGR|nr:uncharacterized protein NAEGRDRAFT_80559 [Naegleria gruberi]EFC41854.1 predicted protein [Naegleria gruberi]|eukprot:XP_002674598.1 predicted protein [Naegleria gruberi strain NEG-M]